MVLAIGMIVEFAARCRGCGRHMQTDFLLTPTPEPASAVLLPGGAALLGLRRRR